MMLHGNRPDLTGSCWRKLVVGHQGSPGLVTSIAQRVMCSSGKEWPLSVENCGRICSQFEENFMIVEMPRVLLKIGKQPLRGHKIQMLK
jgi:hypothetical protein